MLSGRNDSNRKTCVHKRIFLTNKQLPVILKMRRLNGAVLRESATMFVEYSLAAWIMGSCGLTMMCIC